jgi:FMN-dependent NADH-azoreductase
MQLLHIDSSILGDNSVSRQVSAAIVKRLRAMTPDLAVTYRDLAADPLGHLGGAQFAARFGAPVEDAATQAQVATDAAVLAEFLAADIVVIAAPMYNFTLPSQLKAWVDRIIVAGKTFRYSQAGPEGLAGGKRVIVALSRGNFYGPDAPAAAFEHLETYLRTVFGFLGVTDLEFITAEGVQVSPDHRVKALEGALRRAGELRAA